ncbi:hypothetical protein HS088_TW21G01012 [Tripterygium wilfordii]|uniref:Uncharacterized protein n=1 Tax=Tripterygium wilfordii TaxID=458696 RepID=A0A7J7C430_TRIWF|nr:hypothetical protein HS088_TW21G01012 [Tripterygium wilfordii]
MATREHHIMSGTLDKPLTSRSPYGFGYDSIADDYKLVMAKVNLAFGVLGL